MQHWIFFGVFLPNILLGSTNDVGPCLNDIGTADILPRLKQQYDNGRLLVMAVSGHYSWDKTHDGAERFRRTAELSSPVVGDRIPTVVVALGADLHFAVAAFLRDYPTAVKSLQIDYQRESPRRCGAVLRYFGLCGEAANSVDYGQVARAIDQESTRGRMLIAELLDAQSGAISLADIGRMIVTMPSPSRESCLRSILESNVRLRPRGKAPVADLISAAASMDTFHNALSTLADLVGAPQPGGILAFQLVDVPEGCGQKTCRGPAKSQRAIDIALRSLMDQSKESLSIAAARLLH